MSFVLLARKTLHSITKRKMLGLMFLCAALAVLVVLALVLGITWLTADLVALKRSWLDTAINWVVGAVLGIGGWFMLPERVVYHDNLLPPRPGSAGRRPLRVNDMLVELNRFLAAHAGY